MGEIQELNHDHYAFLSETHYQSTFYHPYINKIQRPY